MKYKLSTMALTMITLFACSQTDKTTTEIILPQECTKECVRPYGTVLGSAGKGLESYSNCRPNCVVWDPFYVNHPDISEPIYTGIKWQCVEYSRRWLILNKRLTYGSIDYAYQIWDDITYYTDPKNGVKYPTINFINGSSTKPKVGDLLIYDPNFAGTGHVAVVTDVDIEQEFVRVAEENYLNDYWPGDYAREIVLNVVDGKYFLVDEHLYGWKRSKATP